MSFIAIDLKVIEGLAANAARAAGVSEDRVLAGLVRTWHRCWSSSADVMTRQALAGVFGGDRLDELIEALMAEGFLEPRGDASWRVKGASKYLRVQAGRVLGGQKAAAAGNLKRGTEAPAASQLKLEKSPADPQLTPRLSPNTEHRTPIKEKDIRGPHPKELAEAWNDYRPAECPTVKADELNDDRTRKARARLKEHPSLDDWVERIARIRDSDFCRGLTTRSTWRADFDWLLKPGTFDKIHEGSFDGVQRADFNPDQGILSHG